MIIKSFNYRHFIQYITRFYFDLWWKIRPFHVFKRFQHHCGDRTEKFDQKKRPHGPLSDGKAQFRKEEEHGEWALV